MQNALTAGDRLDIQERSVVSVKSLCVEVGKNHAGRCYDLTEVSFVISVTKNMSLCTGNDIHSLKIAGDGAFAGLPVGRIF